MESLKIILVDDIYVPLLVMEWLPMVRRPSDNKDLVLYISTFVKLVHCLIHGTLLLRIHESIVNILQLSTDMRIGDWFLLQFYTIIHVYGFEGEPYMLLGFLTNRIFTLEYIREIFINDHDC